MINLAGASIAGKRWNEDYKREIRKSPVVGTRGLVRAMVAAQAKPAVFVNGSAIGYYGARDDTPLDESAQQGVISLLVSLPDGAATPASRGGWDSHRRVRTGVVLDGREGPCRN